MWSLEAALLANAGHLPWAGPARQVTGRTWGGCAEVVQWILTAGRFPADPAALDGAVLLLETSEELILPGSWAGSFVR